MAFPADAFPTARRTRTPGRGSPFSSTTRPEIRPSGRIGRSGAGASATTDAPGSPVTTGSALSPTDATVLILELVATPVVLAHPTRQRGSIKRHGEVLKVRIAGVPPPDQR